jgi:hypothetical protein
MTNNWLSLVFVFLLGTGVGGLYFGSLWWTVQRLPRIHHRARWFFINWSLRLLACLGGAAWVLQQASGFQQQGLYLTAYLLGILGVRTLWLIRLQLQMAEGRSSQSPPEAGV